MSKEKRKIVRMDRGWLLVPMMVAAASLLTLFARPDVGRAQTDTSSGGRTGAGEAAALGGFPTGRFRRTLGTTFTRIPWETVTQIMAPTKTATPKYTVWIPKTRTITPTRTPTAFASPTRTWTPSPTGTQTYTRSVTNTLTPTMTTTPIEMPTSTRTPTVTLTPTRTPTLTRTATRTGTPPTRTPTRTVTGTRTQTPTPAFTSSTAS